MSEHHHTRTRTRTRAAVVVALVMLMSVSLACTITITGPATVAPEKSVQPATEPPPQVTVPDTPTDDTGPPVDAGAQTIGRLSPVQMLVELGPTGEALAQVTDVSALHSGDAVRVTRGGEAMMDFGQLWFRLFNDTGMNQVVAALAPNTPAEVQVQLEEGGFLGAVTQPGAQATIRTPNGATISVYGTEFFVIYDAAAGVTLAGMFNGRMEVAAAGGAVALRPGFYVEVGPGAPPGPAVALPPPYNTPRGIQAGMRTRLSPVAVANDIRTVRVRPPSPTNTIVVATVRVFNTPPEISIIDLSPPELVIGKECPNRPRSTIVTVRVIDPTGIESVTASWVVGNQRGDVKFEAVDDQTYQGEIGPVEQVGELVLQVMVRDKEGAENTVQQTIRVQACIG